MKNIKFRLILAVSILIIMTVFSVTGCFFNKDKDEPKKNNNILEQNEKDKKNEIQKKEEEKLDPVNALVIGYDKSKSLTDVVMVVSYVPDDNKMKLVSIPRDLMINFEEDFQNVKAENDNIKIRYCKLTEVNYYSGGGEKAITSLKKIAEKITGLNIDYYAKINLEGFKDLVDSVDGIEFDVPQNMNYSDPSQNLYINLKKGNQVLDGKHAEMLVRFRSYKNGDLGRINMQQQLMMQLVKKMGKKLSQGDILETIKTLFKYVETDFGLLDAVKYSKYITSLDYSNLLNEEDIITIPGTNKRVDGLSYLIWEKEKSNELLGIDK